MTVAFIDKQNPAKPPEPLPIVGRVKYRLDGQVPIEKVCKEWDLWHAYFDWPGGGVPGKALTVRPNESTRIEGGVVTAVPLYSVDSTAVVQELIESVRVAGHGHAEGQP